MTYYVMEQAQERHRLSDRLIRAISHWQLNDMDDDIQGLIKAGADVNRLHGTLLPLHCACMVGDAEILSLLLEKGAKVNAVDGYERTAIHYAAERDETCLRILLQHGALVGQGDGNQDTALHWAAYKNNVSCVRLLLRHGANVNAVDYNHDTPVSWAARKGNLDVIRILLDYNADIEIRNTGGNTPLQRSAAIQASGLNTEQDNGCLELLIKASGRFDLLNDEGQPVPVIARDNRINEMLRPMCGQARPLLDLCRRQIRRSLGQVYLPNVVRSLPVPNRLQDFLLLRDGKEMFLQSLQDTNINLGRRNVIRVGNSNRDTQRVAEDRGGGGEVTFGVQRNSGDSGNLQTEANRLGNNGLGTGIHRFDENDGGGGSSSGSRNSSARSCRSSSSSSSSSHGNYNCTSGGHVGFEDRGIPSRSQSDTQDEERPSESNAVSVDDVSTDDKLD